MSVLAACAETVDAPERIVSPESTTGRIFMGPGLSAWDEPWRGDYTPQEQPTASSLRLSTAGLVGGAPEARRPPGPTDRATVRACRRRSRAGPCLILSIGRSTASRQIRSDA